jgi:hypothetical protein
MKINLIEFDGKHYMFNNDKNEKHQMFIDRTWFIVKNSHKYTTDLKYLENLSYIWVNHKFYGLIYQSDIMDEINKCESIYSQIN